MLFLAPQSPHRYSTPRIMGTGMAVAPPAAGAVEPGTAPGVDMIVVVFFIRLLSVENQI